MYSYQSRNSFSNKSSCLVFWVIVMAILIGLACGSTIILWALYSSYQRLEANTEIDSDLGLEESDQSDALAPVAQPSPGVLPTVMLTPSSNVQSSGGSKSSPTIVSPSSQNPASKISPTLTRTPTRVPTLTAIAPTVRRASPTSTATTTRTPTVTPTRPTSTPYPTGGPPPSPGTCILGCP